MKCQNCGRELLGFEEYCTECGERISNNPNAQSTSNSTNNASTKLTAFDDGCGFAVAALIFGLLGGWLGLVFGILGLVKYKETRNRVMSAIGIFAWAFWMVIIVILTVNNLKNGIA